eukprot:scaffold14423_cov36-Phaeocystis_antarctica.AAC.2
MSGKKGTSESEEASSRIPRKLLSVSPLRWERPPLGLGLTYSSRAPQRRRADRRSGSDRGSSWSEACSDTDCRARRAANPAPRGPTRLLSGPEFVLFGFQQPVQALDRAARARVPIAEGITHPLHRLAEQRLSGGEVTLGVQQRAEAADGAERVRMTIAEGLAPPLQRLVEQWLSGGEVALGLQQRAEHGD